MTSGKVDINGWPIWYEKFGIGNEIILFIPGALGTGRSDYKPQIEGPNAFDHKKYTLIAIELAGLGRSRPPARRYGTDVFQRDADIALKFMAILGYSSYSVIGWSDGAKVGVMMAIKDQSRIKCLVAISILIRVSKETLAPVLWGGNIKNWPKESRDSLYAIYGDSLQLMLDEYVNFWKDAIGKYPSGYLTDDLRLIRCPVLLMHGDQDKLVYLEHPQYCLKHIPDARLYRFPNGAHNCHLTNASEFKKIVETFFDECESCF